MGDDSLEKLTILNHVLSGDYDPNHLSIELLNELVYRGIIDLLAENESSQSIKILYDAVNLSQTEIIQKKSLQTLLKLAIKGNAPAISSLFDLAIYANHKDAQNGILLNSIESTDQDVQSVFWFLTANMMAWNKSDPEMEIITNFFLKAPQQVKASLLDAANKTGYHAWGKLVTALEANTTLAYKKFLQEWTVIDKPLRYLAFNYFSGFAKQGSPVAQEAICHLYIQYDEQPAKKIAIENKFLPQELTDKALFLFLSEQWQIYEQLDFNHALISGAYEKADPSLKRRILSHSRYSGQIEWLKAITGAYRPRTLNEMSEADWTNAINYLFTNLKYDELWRLAQSAPLIWTVRIIEGLNLRNWCPQEPGQSAAFQHFLQIATNCSLSDLSDLIPSTINFQPRNITCLAYNSDAQLLAAGNTESSIMLWNMSSKSKSSSEYSIPTAITRTLIFSANGDYLIVAGGDHHIRILRHSNGQVIKTFSGHTNQIRSLVLSPDDRILYSAGFDGTIRCWRFPTGQEIKQIENLPVEIHNISFIKNGEILVSASAEGKIKTRVLPEGRLIRTFPEQSSAITCLGTSQKGELIASFAGDQMVKIWNGISGRLINQLEVTPEFGKITNLIISPDETSVVASTDQGMVLLWNISTKKPHLQLKTTKTRDRISALCMSSDGKNIYSGNIKGEIKKWDISTFLFINTPLEDLQPNTINIVEDRLNQKRISPAEINWLKLIYETRNWIQRYDIQIGEPLIIQIGEFDIEL